MEKEHKNPLLLEVEDGDGRLSITINEGSTAYDFPVTICIENRHGSMEGIYAEFHLDRKSTSKLFKLLLLA